MALLMGGAMALVMLAFMRSMMYKNRALNLVVIAVAVLVAASGLVLSRSQVLVDDRAYMKGMIPHHSIAILTSERAGLDDVRVRSLADSIIEAQRREIKEMDWLIEDIEKNGPATTEREAQERTLPGLSGRTAASAAECLDGWPWTFSMLVGEHREITGARPADHTHRTVGLEHHSGDQGKVAGACGAHGLTQFVQTDPLLLHGF